MENDRHSNKALAVFGKNDQRALENVFVTKSRHFSTQVSMGMHNVRSLFLRKCFRYNKI